MEIMFKFLYLLIPFFFVYGHAVPSFPNSETAMRYGRRLDDKIVADDTPYLGQWEVVSDNSGVSAMHAILLPKTTKVLMFDATIWRISRIPLPADKMPCRILDPKTNERDCFSHSVLFDIETTQLTALKIQTDTWCSSGGLTVDGRLVSTGGFQLGTNTVRYLRACDTCDWKEYPVALADPRWYATQVTLPDGNFIIVGGRGAFSFEFIPPEGQSNEKPIFFPFLKETHDEITGAIGPNNVFSIENNLYPFVHLSTDGNLFVFANNRSILFDSKVNTVLREYPVLPGGARNYPSSGMSALLPIRLHAGYTGEINAEVLVCGGAPWDSFFYSETKKLFLPALQDCGRIKITAKNPVWKREMMPSRRIMGDMLVLPTGDVLLINGAQNGTSAWNDAEVPNLTPALYRYKARMQHRFKELAPATIPRMYHSTSVVLPDARILVAGSNTNNGYLYDVKYPTELRVEKFSPPYLDPALAWLRPVIVPEKSDTVIRYGGKVNVQVRSNVPDFKKGNVRLTMYAPAFTTHGISMNQRLVILGLVDVLQNVEPGQHKIIAEAPPSGTIAPPGYYLFYVVYKGVPSVATWLQIL